MMLLPVSLAFGAFVIDTTSAQTLLTNIPDIMGYWGEVTPYHDNAFNFFGVQDVGMPNGCQIEQVHTLQRHAQRFPTGSDGPNNERFASKVKNYTLANSGKFTGPLAFLNTYSYIMSESYLTGKGARTEFNRGVSFWNFYGRTLFNSTLGQVAYNASGATEKALPKPVLRSTNQSRIWNSAINWALGFFGPSYQFTPDQTLEGFNDAFSLVLIAEGGTENDTLASYDSCFNDNVPAIGYIGDSFLASYYPLYLKNATARLQAYAPSGFTFNVNDTYAAQSICAYEVGFVDYSDFCGLFTREEWEGFEYTTDLQYYYDYSYGNPTGRAQGLGYLQELIARLEKHLITSSDSSVNSTLDNNNTTFPLNEPFYADFTHDDIIVSTLTAMSFDYFYSKLDPTANPPDASRKFVLSNMTPFGGHLVTEVIGCAAADPAAVAAYSLAYTPTGNGYNPKNATNKFVRFRLNSAILPVGSIRGGACAGRSDGLCPLQDFLNSQKNATALANYDYACFANYTVTAGKDYDGTISKS